MLGEGRTQGHSERGRVPGRPPNTYWCSLVFYVLFHLKVATTDLETEMDSRAGGGRGNRAIRQNAATMLTDAVCVNISVGSEGKMTILKYGTWR